MPGEFRTPYPRVAVFPLGSCRLAIRSLRWPSASLCSHQSGRDLASVPLQMGIRDLAQASAENHVPAGRKPHTCVSCASRCFWPAWCGEACLRQCGSGCSSSTLGPLRVLTSKCATSLHMPMLCLCVRSQCLDPTPPPTMPICRLSACRGGPLRQDWEQRAILWKLVWRYPLWWSVVVACCFAEARRRASGWGGARSVPLGGRRVPQTLRPNGSPPTYNTYLVTQGRCAALRYICSGTAN